MMRGAPRRVTLAGAFPNLLRSSHEDRDVERQLDSHAPAPPPRVARAAPARHRVPAGDEGRRRPVPVRGAAGARLRGARGGPADLSRRLGPHARLQPGAGGRQPRAARWRAAVRWLGPWGRRPALRRNRQEGGLFTGWDYRAGAFHRGWGLRIDHVLLTPALAARCLSVEIDRDERKGKKPSDHAPVVATL